MAPSVIEQAIRYARSQYGQPYTFEVPAEPFDCSKEVAAVLSELTE